MATRIAWLDASVEEQRRVREIVQLFSQRETQDELGGRRIVIALSDKLFPGTSVLHSRARYLLFIPWFAQIAARRKHPARYFERLEREMIGAFLADDSVPEADRLEGLIGRQAGPRVKQLPSTAYWTALDAWGILTTPGSVEETLARTRSGTGTWNPDEPDELATRRQDVWHPGTGEAPIDFPDNTLDGGFRLKHHEATWLRERWLATTREPFTGNDTLLTHLARHTPTLTGGFPWTDPACLSASAEIVEVLHEAHRFSLTSAGGHLLYRLMVNERYVERGFNAVSVDLDRDRSLIDDWIAEVQDNSGSFTGWDPAAFWGLVRSLNARIDEFTRQFFDVWFNRMRAGDLDDLADDTRLRNLVADRERFLKRGQARLANDRLLKGWGGGTEGRTDFRWQQVTRLLTDVTEGIQSHARS